MLPLKQKNRCMPIHLNHRTFYCYTQMLSTPSVSPLQWLALQNAFPKVYWEEEEKIYAGVGAIFSFPNLPLFSEIEEGEIHLFGGRDFFSKRRYETWKSFPSKKYFLPQMLLVQTPDSTKLLIYTNRQDPFFTPINVIGEEKRFLLPHPKRRENLPSQKQWKEMVQSQMTLVEKKQLEKIVLARMSSFFFDSTFCPYALLARLSGTIRFGFQFSPDRTFIGATPELLFSRKGDSLQTAAIAGTRPIGDSDREKEGFRNELLQSKKDEREMRAVENFLRSALHPLSSQLSEKTRSILESSTVQHLVTSFNALLNRQIPDRDLISLLHPTPALGGMPRKKAGRQIALCEPFDRGWYGAPVGHFSKTQSTVAVAIRSALIEQKALHLFGGSGLVEGSNAEEEWEEIERKISPFFLWEK